MEIKKPIVEITLDNDESKLLKRILLIVCCEFDEAIRKAELSKSMRICCMEETRELEELRRLAGNMADEI